MTEVLRSLASFVLWGPIWALRFVVWLLLFGTVVGLLGYGAPSVPWPVLAVGAVLAAASRLLLRRVHDWLRWGYWPRPGAF